MAAEQFKLQKAAAETNNAHVIAKTNLINQKLEAQKQLDSKKLAALQPNQQNQTLAGKLQQLRDAQIPENDLKQLQAEASKRAFIAQNTPELFRMFDESARTNKAPTLIPGYGETQEQHSFKGFLAKVIPTVEGNSALGLIQSGQAHYTPEFKDDEGSPKRRASLASYVQPYDSPLAKQYNMNFQAYPETKFVVPPPPQKVSTMPKVIQQNGKTGVLNPSTGKYERIQ
jgi:hypothetical protein